MANNRKRSSLRLTVLGSIALLLLIVGPGLGSSRFPTTLVAPAQSGVCASIVSPHGYECQEYEVTTKDGYILSVQRIPAGGEGKSGDGGRGPPVLLQHGVLVDGTTWLLNGPGQSLAFILADAGFDVWISNLRGTTHSRRHVTLYANSDRKYWDWTWDDLVEQDLPTIVKLVFDTTGQKVHYVGHSMGTLIALASFSEGKMVDMVKSATLLSPIAYLSHMATAIAFFAANSFIGEIIGAFGFAEFNPKNKFVSEILRAKCSQAQPKINCNDLMTIFTGKNCCLNSSNFELFLEYEPQPTSTKNLVHMAQTVRSRILTKYDYDLNNIEHYGQPRPPIYNLTNIPLDIPIFISYGGQDALSDVKDVENLLDYLKSHNIFKMHVLYIQEYAHADFILGITAKDLVYNKIIGFFTN
ncbi:unnamed protein product [Cuscuta epithymum]|uniref:Lipase n=2 Tax=Cuscuta epithymum TaxID=186058 RepID=A0AAV0D4E8_9ASTE|nr:unnamed protein product [Cuscuta epithymum]